MNTKLKTLITALSQQKLTVFGLMIAERMRPGLLAFARATGYDATYCQSAWSAAWNSLLSHHISEDLIRKCSAAAPDTEVFSHPLTSVALNAVMSVTEVLEFAADGDPQHILNVATLAFDSIYVHLASGISASSELSPQASRLIRFHPLIREEEERQSEDIVFLQMLPERFDAQLVSTLQMRARNQHFLLPSNSLQY